MKKSHSMWMGGGHSHQTDAADRAYPYPQRRSCPYNIMQVLIAVIAVISIITNTGCDAGPGKTGSATPSPTSKVGKGEMRRPWNAIHNWVYWLDTPDLKQLGATNFELAVIDYAGDGSAQKAFSSEQINTLRHSTCQRRVVAYLSVGQAEPYRGYWQKGWKKGSPVWLDSPDPNWGSYWVHYWEPNWQEIIYRYLDDIIAAGFDGIYLDRIDAYEEDYAAGHEDDMVRFVINLARYARAHSPLGEDFGIIVQNAENLAAHHPEYVQTVTGIGRESVYIQPTSKLIATSERTSTEQFLDLFRQNSRGKLVLTVNYTDSTDLIRTAYEQSRAKGYVPYVASTGLNRLQMNTGYEPICHPL